VGVVAPVTPRGVGEWLAILPTAVALLALVSLTIFYMFTGEANAILFGTFGSLLGAGFGTQALAAARTQPPEPGDER
jgi:succinate dehydrogenase hydrophobic anchor subunit